MNKKPQTTVSLEWLISPDTPSVSFDDQVLIDWFDYPIPPEIGHGGGQAYKLLSGMMLFRGETHFTNAVRGQMISMAEVNMALKEPSLVVQSLIRGQALIDDLENGRQYLYNRGNDIYRFTDHVRLKPSHDASTTVEVATLVMGESVLATLLGEGQAKTLLKRLNLLPPPQVHIRPTPAYVTKPLHTALDPSLRGPLKMVVAQARTLEYLAALSQSVQEPSRNVAPDQDKKLVHRLHDYLMQLEGAMPTLLELASMFGRSAQLLNDDFAAEYGESIYCFMQERRMQQAHEAILKTDIALKQLSERMGYTHVSNFSAAFKRRFGYAPGSLRKSGKS